MRTVNALRHRALSSSTRVKITRGNKAGSQFYTVKEVDVLLVYLPRVDKTIWLEAEHFHRRTSITIRCQPAKNNQAKV